jgi:hypothetical protein
MNKTPKYVTPGLSPILKKYKTVTGYNIHEPGNDVDLLRLIFSSDTLFKNTVWKSILKNKNICIHPYSLSFIYSTYEMDNEMVQELNEAYLTYEYKDWLVKYYKAIEKGELGYYQFVTDINNFLKTSFLDCEKRFIIFPIATAEFVFLNGKSINVLGHSCFCIYDSFQEKAFFFDPSQYEYDKVPTIIENNFLIKDSRRKIISYKVLKSLKTANPFLKIKSVEVVDLTAPQFITQDDNCLFWSMLLCDIITKNLKVDEEFKPKLAIRSLLKKYNTKEKLERVIRRYIGYIYEKAKAVPKSFYTNVLKNTYLEN